MIVAGLLLAGLLGGGDLAPVALGDSYASGNGAGNYSEPLCVRSDNAAINTLGTFYGVTMVNGACNGASVNHLRNGRTIAETRSDYRDMEGLDGFLAYGEALADCTTDMSDRSAQLDMSMDGSTMTAFCTTTLHPQVELTAEATDIFVTIGGNDIGFVSVASACLVSEEEVPCREAVDEATQLLTPTLNREREAILEIQQINPDARIHLVPYPRLLGEEEYLVGTYNVAADINAFQAEWETELQMMADELSTDESAVHYVETLTPLWEGHGLGSAESWIHTGGNVGEFLHPNTDGWEVTGYALLAHLGLTRAGLYGEG